MLVWAIGSLEGYTNRVELLCAEVDCAEGLAKPIPVEQAQELLRTVSDTVSGTLYGIVDVEALITGAEEVLLGQFKGTSDAFVARDNLLTEKAKQAVQSHAQRQIDRNERQLQREDLNINLRNMYQGWNRRIGDETISKLAEIDQKGGSSLITRNHRRGDRTPGELLAGQSFALALSRIHRWTAQG